MLLVITFNLTLTMGNTELIAQHSIASHRRLLSKILEREKNCNDDGLVEIGMLSTCVIMLKKGRSVRRHDPNLVGGKNQNLGKNVEEAFCFLHLLTLKSLSNNNKTTVMHFSRLNIHQTNSLQNHVQ